METGMFNWLFRKGQKKGIGASIDSLVGERCTVVEEIDNYAGCGAVRVGNQIWAARGVGEDDIFEKGTSLKIVAIEGVKMICKK